MKSCNKNIKTQNIFSLCIFFVLYQKVKKFVSYKYRSTFKSLTHLSQSDRIKVIFMFFKLQTFGGLVCLEENRNKLRVPFTSGLISTSHKALDFRLINQIRLVEKVEGSPRRASYFLSLNQIKGNFRGSLRAKCQCVSLKSACKGVFRSQSKRSEMSR